MRPIRKRLTYANVMSSIAVFLILGGATAVAAKKIGTKQIKANSITTGKIKKNAVTTAKIKNNAVTTSKLRNDAVTGDKVNESTLGQVPSALNAVNADTVGGNSVKKIFYQGTTDSPAQTILSFHGLTLTASCTSNDIAANATTSVPNSMIHSGGVILGGTVFYAEEDLFSPGENFDFLVEGTTGGDSVQGSLTYAQPDGKVVTAVFMSEESAAGNVFGADGCAITGYATG